MEPTSASKETIGQRLQRLRLESGFSQSELAKASMVPIGTIRNIEYDRRNPSLEIAGKLAKALGVSLDILAGIATKNTKPRGRSRAKK
jgi:transcriptional regulator with XRE-family HTH domain